MTATNTADEYEHYPTRVEELLDLETRSDAGGPFSGVTRCSHRTL